MAEDLERRLREAAEKAPKGVAGQFCVPEDILALLEALDASRARVDALEKALEPFADEAAMWAEAVSDKYRPKLTEPGKTAAYGPRARFTIGDLRRAAAFSRQEEGNG